MIKIINKTNRTIEIAKNLRLKAYESIELNGSINKTISQLQKMRLIEVKILSDERAKSLNSVKNVGEYRREQLRERIMNGDIKKSISLDNTLLRNDLNKNQQSQKKSKRKN